MRRARNVKQFVLFLLGVATTLLLLATSEANDDVSGALPADDGVCAEGDDSCISSLSSEVVYEEEASGSSVSIVLSAVLLAVLLGLCVFVFTRKTTTTVQVC